MISLLCPVCTDKSQQNPIAIINSLEAANHFVRYSGATKSQLLQEHIRDLWGADECSIIRCNKCGCRYANPHISGDSYFYELASSEPGWPEFRWEFNQTKQIVSSLLKTNDLLLEIGGGSGAFVKELLAEGVQAKNIVVTEYSGVACSELEKLGVKVEQVDFRDEVPGHPFRAVVLFQTLEHLDRLDEVTSALCRLTTKDADVFLSVPNAEYIDWQERNLGLIDMPPNHITAFSKEGLRKLFARSSFTIFDMVLETPIPIDVRLRRVIMHKLTNPTNSLERFTFKIASMKKTRLRKLRLICCAMLLMFANRAWIRKVPPENIWVHLKRRL